MESREDQIFEMFEGLRDYSQEPPSSVYSGIRKRMWWSGFLHFSATSLNVYYVGALLVAGLATVIYTMPEENIQAADGKSAKEVQISREVAQDETTETVEKPVAEQPEEKVSFEKAASSSSPEVAEESTEIIEEVTVDANEETAKESIEKPSDEFIQSSPIAEKPMSEEMEEVTEEPATEEMTEIENKEVTTLPAIPYDKAIYTIDGDLMDQIKDPKKETITLTINEKRKVEEEK